MSTYSSLLAEILGLQRTETYEIPIPAIREALINAIVHRDYSNFGRDIKVGIYDDALNIVSPPGGLPNGLLLENALQGRSEIRNKVVFPACRGLVSKTIGSCLAAASLEAIYSSSVLNSL